MTRRAFVATVIGVPVTGMTVPTSAAPVEITGMLGGPDVEGGYFELVATNGQTAHEVILMTTIGSPLYPLLREMVGRDVAITVRPLD
jgi:hypothetical protein